MAVSGGSTVLFLCKFYMIFTLLVSCYMYIVGYVEGYNFTGKIGKISERCLPVMML